MSQLSRPYQIVLAAVLVFAVAWFAVLRAHVSSSSGSSSTPASTASTPAPTSKATIAAEEKVAAKPTHVHKGTATSSKSGTTASSKSGTADPPSKGATGKASPPASRATLLSKELEEGRTVLLLFWNPSSSADVAVREQVQDVARSLGHRVAASYAKAREVGSFGTVTRDVSVNETPTLLVIGKKGLVTTITGLTDAFSIEQAVREAHA